MILGLEFPPISHVVEWPTLFGEGAFAVNKVIILMWVSAALAFTVMYLGGRKGALVPSGIQNVAESAVDFVEEGIILQTIGPDGLAALDGLALEALTAAPNLRLIETETVGGDIFQHYERR